MKYVFVNSLNSFSSTSFLGLEGVAWWFCPVCCIQYFRRLADLLTKSSKGGSFRSESLTSPGVSLLRTRKATKTSRQVMVSPA